MKGAAGEQKDDQSNHSRSESSFVINIPSYQEVIESSRTEKAPSLFNPSSSFSQAFNFIKNSEFYEPPPPPPPPPPPRHHPKMPIQGYFCVWIIGLIRALFVLCSRIGQPEVVGSSYSAVASTSKGQNGPSRNAILVSHRQGCNVGEVVASPLITVGSSLIAKGNPSLKHIRNVRRAFADIVCDYLLGQNSCALYLSLRYHLLHPDYLYYRIRELQKNYKLRVVLCHVDVEDVVKPLLEVTKTALLHDCTLLCGWSLEECARYLETTKVYENKPADIIQGQMDTEYLSRLNHALTTVRRVNKTDVVTLGSTFGSLSHIMDASMEDLARCPGIGERKVKRLYDTFHEPFKRVTSNRTSGPEAVQPITVGERKEDENRVEDASKRKKEDPGTTVKSALSAAFAKYKERVGEKNIKSQQGKGEEENRQSSEEAAS
ncbi:hypothetical protein RJ639_010173 [Escallonia herrerae]|uniref:DNA excision repair protein ERCC-1 n=1 Tax=Escallonia herrerae TaxID=1293975 RepID=A0AA88VUR8_9ASTE|nr:hypothetical protein RJ639_010173 [Escallonia herrerae]